MGQPSWTIQTWAEDKPGSPYRGSSWSSSTWIVALDVTPGNVCQNITTPDYSQLDLQKIITQAPRIDADKFVHCPDAGSAIEAAIEEFKVPWNSRGRLTIESERTPFCRMLESVIGRPG